MAGKKRRKAKRRQPAGSAAQPGLKAVSRAQLGPDDERRPYRPREEDASIEDPLQDWPKEE